MPVFKLKLRSQKSIRGRPISSYPGEDPVSPNTDHAIIAVDMVFLADVREIQIPDSIFTVKADEQPSITYGDVSGHWKRPFGWSIGSVVTTEPPGRPRSNGKTRLSALEKPDYGQIA